MRLDSPCCLKVDEFKFPSPCFCNIFESKVWICLYKRLLKNLKSKKKFFFVLAHKLV